MQCYPTIRTMQRAMTDRKFDRPVADRIIHEPEHSTALMRRIVRGLADELNDRQYLIVDGTDGRQHMSRSDAAMGSTPRKRPGHLQRDIMRIVII